MGHPLHTTVVTVVEDERQGAPRFLAHVQRVVIGWKAPARPDGLKGLDHRTISADRANADHPRWAALRRKGEPRSQQPHGFAMKYFQREAVAVLLRVEPRTRIARADGVCGHAALVQLCSCSE